MPARLDVLVVGIGDDMQGPARRLVAHLRAEGRRAETPYTPVKVNKAFKLAQQAGAAEMWLVGAEDWSRQEVQVKDLATGAQSTRKFDLD